MDYRSIVLRLLILYVFINGTNVLAQTQVIVGDTVKIAEGKYVSRYSQCQYQIDHANYRKPLEPHPITFLTGKYSWEAYYPCNEIGLVKDTALFELILNFDPNFICKADHDFQHVEVSALGISDSLVLIRPQNWTVDLYFDTNAKQWTGSTIPNLKNNVGTASRFSSWGLKRYPDSSLHIEVTDSMDNPIGAVNLTSFSRSSIKLQFRSSLGSSFKDIIINDTLLTKVTNGDKDSVYWNYITFVLHAVPFKVSLKASTDSIAISGSSLALNSKTLTLNPSYIPSEVLIDTPRYPFIINYVNRTMTDGRSSDSLIVTCIASTSGNYSDIMSVRYAFKDWLGNVHYAKQLIQLSATILNKEHEVWEETPFIPHGEFYGFTVGLDSSVYANTEQGIFRSIDEGSSWYQISNKRVSELIVSQIRRYDSLMQKVLYSDIMVGISNSKVVISLDTGKSWQDCFKKGYTIKSTRSLEAPWDAEAEPLSVLCNIRGEIYSSGFVYNRKYYSPDDYKEEIITSTFKSTDLGKTWQAIESQTKLYTLLYLPSIDSFTKIETNQQLNSYLQDTTLTAFEVSTDADLHGRLYYGTNAGIYTYNPDAKVVIYRGLIKSQIESIVVDNNDIGYAVTKDGGAFRSTDLGTTWEGYNAGLKTKTWSHAIVSPNNRVYIYSPYSGVYRLKDPAPSSVKKERSSSPEKEYGVDLYPNPASNMVSVAVNRRNLFSSIPLNKLQIVDVLGNVKWERYLSVPEEKGSENLVTNIDLRSYKPGLYFVRLISPNSVKTQKLLIERSR